MLIFLFLVFCTRGLLCLYLHKATLVAGLVLSVEFDLDGGGSSAENTKRLPHAMNGWYQPGLSCPSEDRRPWILSCLKRSALSLAVAAEIGAGVAAS